MKKILFLLFVFMITNFVFAQDYFITFSGAGESNIVSKVIVENLTQGKNIVLSENDVLHLKNTVTEISHLVFNQNEGIQFNPNPMKEISVIEFATVKDGYAKVELFDISGRKHKEVQSYLNSGRQSYNITGVDIGIYFLKVTADNKVISGKLISEKKSKGVIEITHLKTIPFNYNSINFKSAKSEIPMQYNEGDLLKFTATGGDHKSVHVDVITKNKNIVFQFYKCIDLNKRNYATVEIGTKIWMAENFAYLPSVSPSIVGSSTEPYYYVYGYEGTNVVDAQNNINYTNYGVLYNWSAAKDVCPTGWHLPTDSEWAELESYLIKTGYNFDGTNTENKIAKSMAATTFWSVSSNTGSVGSNPSSNNKSGFSAYPGGYRHGEGRFEYIGTHGYWWSSTEFNIDVAWHRYLHYKLSALTRFSYFKGYGFSVRYVKDN